MREEQKTEAINRMKMLGIFPETIKQFERKDLISRSEPPFGAFFWVEDEDLDRIKEFEKEHNALVYLVIRSYTDIGVLDDYLYVTEHQDEWERDRDNIKKIKDDAILAYTYNHDDPYCSEFGYIYVSKTPAAGLKRIF